MAPSRVPGYDEARKRLLDEGARSYLEAMTALVEFQREVQKKCTSVMEANLDNYATALGLGLTTDEIRNAAWPSIDKWEGDWWTLGAHILRKNDGTLRWWESYCCLQFETDEGHFCYVGQEFPTSKLATTLFQQFRRLDAKVELKLYGNEVWLQHNLTVEEVAEFEGPLAEIFQQWIDLWAKVGGIKEFLK
jgi:hypothetical protein